MDKLKKYLDRKGITYHPNVGGGITIECPYQETQRVVNYIKRRDVNFHPDDKWCSHDYKFTMIPVYGRC